MQCTDVTYSLYSVVESVDNFVAHQLRLCVQRDKRYTRRHLEMIMSRMLRLCTTALVEHTTETLETWIQLQLLLLAAVSEHLHHQNSASQTTSQPASINH